jgi:cell division protein FtsI (penicillin-binding protein 3)
MYSSNICMAQMAFAAGGAKTMQPFFEKVGFFEKPDIELPQAELGSPQVPKRWPDITVATASFGHGIAISPFQYVSGMAGLMGGPRWIKPTLLRREPGDFVASLPPPVSARTAADLRWLLWLTVQKGTGEKAKQANYLIGGKTGTADKPGLKGQGRGYHTGAVLASFIGVFPVEAPRYLVLAVLDDPHGDASSKGLHYAAWTAAPVVGVIVDRIGPLLGVRPSDPKANDAFAERLVVTKLEGRKEERLAALGPSAAAR